MQRSAPVAPNASALLRRPTPGTVLVPPHSSLVYPAAVPAPRSALPAALPCQSLPQFKCFTQVSHERTSQARKLRSTHDWGLAVQEQRIQARAHRRRARASHRAVARRPLLAITATAAAAALASASAGCDPAGCLPARCAGALSRFTRLLPARLRCCGAAAPAPPCIPAICRRLANEVGP